MALLPLSLSLKCWKRGICCLAELAGLLLHDEEFLLLWLLVAGWWERGSSTETWLKKKKCLEEGQWADPECEKTAGTTCHTVGASCG